jgi:hypothetical protein
MVNKTIMKNIIIHTIATISSAIFLATVLASLIALSVLQQHDGIYVYGQTQGIAGGKQHHITNAASPSNMLSLSRLPLFFYYIFNN